MCFILLLLFSVFHVGLSQVGSDCTTDEDCNPFQHCHFGYCNCEFGYVKNIALQHCFECKSHVTKTDSPSTLLPFSEVKRHGDECYFDIQCNDHRMECKVSNPEEDIRRCTCDRYHDWSDELKECYPNFNITELLENLGDGNDIGKQIETEAERVFLGVVIVGLTIVSFLMSFIAICSVYGCCIGGKKASGDFEDSRKGIDDVAVVGLPDAFDDIGGDMGMDFAF